MSRTRYTLFLALLAFLGVIIGSCSTAPSAGAATVDIPKPLVGQCRYVTYVNAFASPGDDLNLDEIMSTTNYFPIHRCRTEGMRVEIAFGNTKSEVRELQHFANRPSPNLIAFCRTGKDEGYAIYLAWIANHFDSNKVEVRDYPQWFNDYTSGNNCRR